MFGTKKKKPSIFVLLDKKDLNQEEAQSLVKAGVISGFILVVGKVLAMILLLAGLIDYTKVPGNEGATLFGTAFGVAVEILLYSFFTWKVFSKKSLVSLILLMMFFGFDHIYVSVVNGTIRTSVIVYSWILLGMIAGLKGCWWYQKHLEEKSDVVPSEIAKISKDTEIRENTESTENAESSENGDNHGIRGNQVSRHQNFEEDGDEEEDDDNRGLPKDFWKL